MASLSSSSSSLRFFYPPKLPNPFIKSSFTLTFLSPISFQRLSNPPSSSSSNQHQHQHQPIIIRAQAVQQQQPNPIETLPPKLKETIALFQSAPDTKSKYNQLLAYATKLPPFPPQFKTDEHRVRGCVSQVWVRAYPDPDDPSKVRFDADSDSQFTKGLAALLVFGLSGESPAVIAGVSPDFVKVSGLSKIVSPSRNNGLLNMLLVMQVKAAQIGGLDFSGQDAILKDEVSNLDGNNDGFESNLEMNEVSGVNGEEVSGIGGLSMNGQDGILSEEDPNLGENNDGFRGDSAMDEVSGANGSGIGGRRERIREILERELNPVELEVDDISHLHAGHVGVRGNSGGETHFNVRAVSTEFEGKSMLKRHRLVYDLLREEMESGLHALSIVAKTPSEV